MKTLATTVDTERAISAPALPACGGLSGYEYMELAERKGWRPIASWGADGWDFGEWPYVIGFYRPRSTETGNTWGYALYVEGDLTTRYYDSREAFIENVDREAFFYWKLGKSDGPDDLPEKFEDMPAEYRGMCRI